MFLVPVNAESSDISETFLRAHVLQPVGQEGFMTLDQRKVRVEEGKVVVEGRNGLLIESRIVYSETFYDAEFRSLRVVNVARFLTSNNNNNTNAPLSPSPSSSSSSLPSAQPQLLDLEALRSRCPSVMAVFARRLEKFQSMMVDTFSVAALARHGPLVQRSIGFFCRHAWELTNDTVSDMGDAWGNAVSRNSLICSVEAIIMDRLHSTVMPLLCVMHADHDAALALASAASTSSSSSVPQSLTETILAESTSALAAVVTHTTPLGKLQCVQRCVDVLSKNATQQPVTADELLPMLIAAIIRCKADHLCAHFSYIQFRQDKSPELSYYLTTLRAALEFIRQSGDQQPVAEGAARDTQGFAFATEVPARSQVQSWSLASLRSDMRNGSDPLEVKDRWYRLTKYRNVFVASEFVDWIVRHHNISRSQATLLGRKMLLEGNIRHVTGVEKDFEDDYLFFNWVDAAPSIF